MEDKKKHEILEKEMILKQEQTEVDKSLKILDLSNYSKAKHNADWYNNLKSDWKVMSQK